MISGRSGFYIKEAIQNSTNHNVLDFVSIWKFHSYYVERKFINNTDFFKIITYVPLETLKNFLRKNWISSVHSQPYMKRAYPVTYVVPNPFHDTDLFRYPLKTSENLWFSDVFRGYQKRSVAWNGLIMVLTLQKLQTLYTWLKNYELKLVL